ncbi:MAG: HAD-IA family hydrolase [Deltaproteobacteria bacterium]|nr:HAD-IA family hydrolase [Deltaproteobacteria bacterium]
MKALIFDLDQTLVDTEKIEPLRRAHNWRSISTNISKIAPYDGIGRVLSITMEKNIKLAIVSSGPSCYVQQIVRHFDWSFDEIVCYHDSVNHKPHPDPFIEVSNRLLLPPKDCWTVGDDAIDIIAAKAAGMYTIGALWGSLNKDSLKNSNPDITLETVESLLNIIQDQR